MPIKECPKCGSDHIQQDEVDIGVGIQYGPASCCNCDWHQPSGLEDLLPDD